MFRTSTFHYLSSSRKHIIPPGTLPSTKFQHIIKQRKNSKNSNNNNNSLTAQALQACGINHSEKLAERKARGETDNKESKTARGKLNAAELTEDEVNMCLQTLPRYVDLATSRLSHGASARALAQTNYGSPLAVHANAIRNLKMYIYKRGLYDDLPSLEKMSLKEVQRRFGETKEVKEFLTVWKNSFVIDTDELYSISTSNQ